MSASGEESVANSHPQDFPRKFRLPGVFCVRVVRGAARAVTMVFSDSGPVNERTTSKAEILTEFATQNKMLGCHSKF